MICACSMMSRCSKICGYAVGIESTSAETGSTAVIGLEGGTMVSVEGYARCVFGGCRVHIHVATKLATSVGSVGAGGSHEKTRVKRGAFLVESAYFSGF